MKGVFDMVTLLELELDARQILASLRCTFNKDIFQFKIRHHLFFDLTTNETDNLA